MALNNESEILEAKRYLEGKYSTRDQAYVVLRKLYNADYWGDSEVQGIKLVYNLIASVVDRYTDFMVLPPDWQVIPADVSKEAKIIAEKQERILYSQWELNDILILQQWQANLQSLYGFFGFLIMPDLESKERYVKIHSLIPENILPMPKSDNINDLDYVIIKAMDYKTNDSKFNPAIATDQRRYQTNVILYCDKEKVIKMVDGKEVMRIEHNFGFINCVLGQNRVKPHFIEGIGDVDQAIGLNQYLNELISWQGDIIEYSANPLRVFKGLAGDQKIPNGPGGSVQLNADGDARFVTWDGSPPDVERMINRVIQGIQDMTNINDAALGRDVPSGTSGSAVRSLLSGIQAAMLRKQVTLGNAYIKVNEMIFAIIEKMFSEKEIVVRGTKRGNTFVDKIKGKDINGNYRNKAIWPPGVLDLGSRINLETLKLNNRLQSRITTMENIGVLSPLEEMQRIRMEEEEEIQRQARLANPTGVPPTKQAEFDTAQRQLQSLDSGGGGDPITALAEFIRGVPKIRGAVLFGGQEGESFVIVLTEMKDKATIANKLPAEFKGKIVFRKYDEAKDGDLQAIVENEAEPVA